MNFGNGFGNNGFGNNGFSNNGFGNTGFGQQQPVTSSFTTPVSPTTPTTPTTTDTPNINTNVLQNDEEFDNVMKEMESKTIPDKNKPAKKTNNTKSSSSKSDIVKAGTVVVIYGDQKFTTEKEMTKNDVIKELIDNHGYYELSVGKVMFENFTRDKVNYINVYKSFNKNG